tara:strand:- start:1055 stop:1357 length:303 start_codon:yes stop_codon:yes gene_type:complete
MYKIINILIIIFFVTSCETLKTTKKTLSGEKEFGTDEFMVQKKDPLILPPDYENLPTPDEEAASKEEILNFEKTLEISVENNSSTSSSTEESILKKIRSK